MCGRIIYVAGRLWASVIVVLVLDQISVPITIGSFSTLLLHFKNHRS
jgi:hypothetical protein